MKNSILRSLSSQLLLLGLLPLCTRAQIAPADKAFLQRYSIQYLLPDSKVTSAAAVRQLAVDRNGVVQVAGPEGLLRTWGGQLLFPGELAPDRTYRPLLDRRIQAIGTYDKQIVYADAQAIFSNAWAGSWYVSHPLPGINRFCGGPGFQFLLTDGHALAFLKDSAIAWKGAVTDSVLDIQYDPAGNCFLVLGQAGVQVFSPADRSLKKVCEGSGLRCLALRGRELLVGTTDGYFTLSSSDWKSRGAVNRRLPCTDLHCIRVIDGQLWFGSSRGAFLLGEDGRSHYFASRRWLPSDQVVDMAGDPSGTVYILTDKGVGAIHTERMTLAEKADFYERQVRSRHIRLGFNSTLGGMQEGDIRTGSLEDSDNDGLWTSMYLGAEAFRYAATRSPEALQNCRESLDAMERLFTVNSMVGFPSRSYERAGYESADTQVWRKSKYPGWDWKSTTSSDEAIGHIFVYGVLAELVDAPDVRKKAIRLMDALMQHIIDHDMYLVDWNGLPTTWGRWNPDYVNARPPMVGDRKINSSNIIGMLQTAWHFTGKAVYRDKAWELMKKHGYLENLLRPMKDIGSAPADADDLSKRLSEGWNHSDDEMYFLGYWGLYRYAFNDTLKAKYKVAILDHFQQERPEKDAAWNIFTAMMGVKDYDREGAIWYLQRYPLDLTEWTVRNSQRKDIDLLPANFRDQYTKEVLPPDELPVFRHNTNRFHLDGGNGGRAELSAGDIWLLPYWMGRWLGVIGGAGK